MNMYFKFKYSMNGAIAPCECTEVQEYHADLQDAHKIIKKDLSKALRAMRKRSDARLYVGTDAEQKFYVRQQACDADNDVYDVTDEMIVTKKVGGRALKKMVLALYDSIVSAADKVDSETPVTVIDDAKKNLAEIMDDVAGDGTPYSEVMQEIVDDGKKAKKSINKKEAKDK